MTEQKISKLMNQLTCKGIRPSYQRIKILEYLRHCNAHPTVDEIYTALSPTIPTLSKATIYNTLHAFIEAGLVREINIENDHLRYDIMVENHGHFRCNQCGEIFNFNVDIDQLSINGLQDFQVEKKDIYYSGLCPSCQLSTISE